ncbi:MAG: hypothetical protein RIS29_2327 [Bacteroidota bacterium]|jgi:ABC-type Fe3+ transport system substrate-binding protein
MNKREINKKIDSGENKEYNIDRVNQKPIQTESELTKSLLNDPESKLKVLSSNQSGAVKFDSPHLRKHNQSENFLVSLLPPHLQDEFCQLFAERFQEFANENAGAVIYHGHYTQDNVFYKQLAGFKSAFHLPEILITSDINCLYESPKGYINPNNFETFSTQYNSIFAGTGIDHPQRIFRFLGAEALVMVVDKNLTEQIQTPREWYELLNPAMKDSLVICGEKDYYNDTLYLHFVRDFGLEAVKQLHANTLERIHPEEILHALNNDNSLGACIYVMPYSWAKLIDNKLDFQIIWPEDGAIILPIQMLVKKSVSEKYRNVTRFLGGQEVGNLLRNNGFISTNPRVIHPVSGRKLNWLGWEFIRNSNLVEIRNDIKRIITD